MQNRGVFIMKLSMWMIANRLKPLNPESQISDDTPAVLKSARRAYATNCVYVFPSGNDVICQWENDIIKSERHTILTKHLKLSRVFLISMRIGMLL